MVLTKVAGKFWIGIALFVVLFLHIWAIPSSSSPYTLRSSLQMVHGRMNIKTILFEMIKNSHVLPGCTRIQHRPRQIDPGIWPEEHILARLEQPGQDTNHRSALLWPKSQDAGSRILDSGSWILDLGLKVRPEPCQRLVDYKFVIPRPFRIHQCKFERHHNQVFFICV